jgi:GNAT superfamily N-acetyltransferase
MITAFTTAGEAPVLEVTGRPGLTLPRVEIRPLARGQTGPVVEVFDRMSPHSRRMRFLGPMAALTDSMLYQLTDVDHQRHGCWYATVGNERVALGRYLLDAKDPTVAEIALDVIDAYQGHGLGRLLLDILSVAASDVGVTTLSAVMDASNTRVLRLATPLGGSSSSSYGAVEGWAPVPRIRGLEAAHVLVCARTARRCAATRSAA